MIIDVRASSRAGAVEVVGDRLDAASGQDVGLVEEWIFQVSTSRPLGGVRGLRHNHEAVGGGTQPVEGLGIPAEDHVLQDRGHSQTCGLLNKLQERVDGLLTLDIVLHVVGPQPCGRSKTPADIIAAEVRNVQHSRKRPSKRGLPTSGLTGDDDQRRAEHSSQRSNFGRGRWHGPSSFLPKANTQ